MRPDLGIWRRMPANRAISGRDNDVWQWTSLGPISQIRIDKELWAQECDPARNSALCEWCSRKAQETPLPFRMAIQQRRLRDRGNGSWAVVSSTNHIRCILVGDHTCHHGINGQTCRQPPQRGSRSACQHGDVRLGLPTWRQTRPRHLDPDSRMMSTRNTRILPSRRGMSRRPM